MKIGRLKISRRWDFGNSPLGRFGGGWNWQVGVQVSTSLRTIIINCLVFSVRLSLEK